MEDALMKPVEFWYWNLRSGADGAWTQSNCRLTEAEALRRDPQASRVPGSCEVRVLPKHPDDYLPRMAFANARRQGTQGLA
jgi:hypothetical protein